MKGRELVRYMFNSLELVRIFFEHTGGSGDCRFKTILLKYL
jgi:hypothetical protein